MSVVRIPNKKKNYTQISNDTISYAASGVLTRLLSKPPKWKPRVAAMVREGLNGETEIYRILEELQLAGYVVKSVGRNAEGRIVSTDYIVYEKPQIMDTSVVAKLTQQREARRHKKQANNRKRAGQPHIAEPDTVPPDEAEPTPRKDRVDRKDRKKKAEPLPPDGRGADSSFDSEAEGGGVGKAAPVYPDIPEDIAGKNSTETPAASRPEFAAYAAPNPEVMSKGALPDPRSPEFPKLPGGSPDWLGGVCRFDADCANLLRPIWKDSPLNDARLARKYYKARCNGHLIAKDVRLIADFWELAFVPRDACPPASLWEALDKLPLVLAACRDEVKQAIDDIRTDGETDDGLSHVLNRIAAAGMAIQPETDMVEFLDRWPDCVAPLFVAAQVKTQRLPEAVTFHRGDALEEIAKWPHWLEHRKEYADYKRILGFTYDEARAAADARAADNAQRIADLEKYLA